MKVSVYDIIGSELAINQKDGEDLFNNLSDKNLKGLIVSFEKIERVSTLFLNESFGKLAVLFPSEIGSISLEIPEGKNLIRAKVENVIENALMGDDYDSLIDAAKMAL